jgi:hypothetical protein
MTPAPSGLTLVMDDLDRSYTQVVEFRTDTPPEASVAVGKTQSGPIPLPPRPR